MMSSVIGTREFGRAESGRSGAAGGVTRLHVTQAENHANASRN